MKNEWGMTRYLSASLPTRSLLKDEIYRIEKKRWNGDKVRKVKDADGEIGLKTYKA
jgi:hypothetical protein